MKNQSQLRVPPMPWITALFLSANGNCRPELSTALLLPAAGLPMTMYHGSSYSAEPPDTWPIFDVLIVFTASDRRVRSTSRSAVFASGGERGGGGRGDLAGFRLLLQHLAELLVRALHAPAAPQRDDEPQREDRRERDRRPQERQLEHVGDDEEDGR